MVSFYNDTEREKGRFIMVISIDKWFEQPKTTTKHDHT